MLQELTKNMESKLFNYFTSTRESVPYYFKVDFENWHKSMFNDHDYDGKPMFADLKTFLLMNEDEIEGFIQYGLTSFVFDEKGNKDYTKHYAVVRNIHFLKNAKNPHVLLDKAKAYFDEIGAEKSYAYFHFFGMSCYARQGKLHDTEFYIEDLLCKYGYTKEHENVYYSKLLRDADVFDVLDIDFVYKNNDQEVSFMMGNEKIGGAALNFLPHSDICYLKWIYTDSKHGHKGLGTKCINKLFYDLKKRNISRLDTDTADNNVIAQGLYEKTGFSNMGRMRSYFTL